MKKVFLNGVYYFVVDNPNKGMCIDCAVANLKIDDCWTTCGEDILKKVSDLRKEKMQKIFK